MRIRTLWDNSRTTAVTIMAHRGILPTITQAIRNGGACVRDRRRAVRVTSAAVVVVEHVYSSHQHRDDNNCEEVQGA